MFIQTEATPNPATLKFLPGRQVMASGVADFPDAEAARAAPLAAALFTIEGVCGVFFGADFIAVSKAHGAWEHLKPAILGAIMEHAQSGAPFAPAAQTPPQAAGAAQTPEQDQVVQAIQDLIETHVRPAVAQDGGDIVFGDYDDGVVYLHLRGACAGCPSAEATLRQGIENLLRHYVPEVRQVRQVPAPL